MPVKPILKDIRERMIKAEQHFVHELAGVRTGKASTALVENIQVEAYGAVMRIREIASITTPEPRLLLIQPWDASLAPAIEKAILKSNLGLTPVVDNKVVRIVFPELTTERRQELIKVVRRMAEEARVAIRNLRREAMEQLRKEKKDGALPEDEERQAEKELQKITDEFVGKIDDHLKRKEEEIMSV